jgi:iron(II)-dependent oxidoreductase
MGACTEAFAYDNEVPCHLVELPDFEIDRWPVTGHDFAAFIEERGYERRELWSPEGWSWLQEARVRAPLGWRGPSARPVEHVCFHEAEAYARFRGRRLPTEAEWEKAAPVLEGRGRVWEWTSTDFAPYPGFEPFPYEEYSVPFFDRGMKVLRGGSWATSPAVARATFRNWDFPVRRQIFAGLRLARDA